MSEVKRYAIIENSFVVNIIKWDGITQWSDEVVAIDLTDYQSVRIGDSYSDGTFTPQQEEPLNE